MAVYTVLSDAEMSDMLGNYDVGILKEYQGISKGIMNSNYLIVTDKNKYILRILEGERDLDEEKKELRYLELLSENGISCPKVIFTKDGRDYLIYNGKMVSLFSFLEGSEIEEPDSVILEKFGAILAKMHIVSENGKLKRKEGIEFSYLFDSITADMGKLERILGNDFEKVMDKIESVEECSFGGLPSGIIHNDIFPDNVFIKDGEITGIIDFNDAMTAPFIGDISIVLNFWIYNKYKRYDISLIKAFFKGYETVRPMTEREKSILPVALDKTALTFLFLRIKKFYIDAGSATREFKDFRDLLPMVFENKNIGIS